MPQPTEYLQTATSSLTESLRQARSIHEDSIEVLRDLTAVLLPVPALDGAVQRGFDTLVSVVGSQYDLATSLLERITPEAA